MPKLNPWFHVVTPGTSQNRPVDASEFAVNLEDRDERRIIGELPERFSCDQ